MQPVFKLDRCTLNVVGGLNHHSPSPLAGVAETVSELPHRGEKGQSQKMAKPSYQKKKKKKKMGMVFQTHHLRSRLPLLCAHFYLQKKKASKKQNGGTWNRENGTIYLRKERKGKKSGG